MSSSNQEEWDGRSQGRDGAGVEYSETGDIVRERTADGSVLESFDSFGRPHEGIQNHAHYRIDYGANGRVVNTFDDGTVIEYDAAGRITREETPDGTVYDNFDDQGRAIGGSSPDSPDFTVDYPDDGGSVVHYSDGTSAAFDAAGNLVPPPAADVAVHARSAPASEPLTVSTTTETTANDGTVYSAFDGRGRPISGRTAEGDPFTITYDDRAHSSTTTFGDGTSVTADAAGETLRLTTPDGSVYTSFDSTGRPTHGVTGDGQTVDLTYLSDGGSTVRYSGPDGTVTVTSGADGDPLRMVTEDATFDRFDDAGRPIHGVSGDGQTIELSYGSDGTTTTSYTGPDGTVTVTSGADGDPVRMVTADGMTYTSFDGDGRPLLGTDVAGERVSFSYDDAAGTTTATYQSTGTVVVSDADGDVVRMTTGDGTVYTSFDASGRPTEGTTPDGRQFELSYDDTAGTSTVSYPDGTVVTSNSDGDPISMVTPDVTYTAFDDQGRPTGGYTTGGDPISLAYDDGADTTTRYADGTEVVTGEDGSVLTMTTPDGTVYTSFDDRGRPVSGTTAPGEALTISYDDGVGTTTVRYGSGSETVSDADGNPVRLTTTDGTVFSDFYSDGRPRTGTTAQGETFTMTYDDTARTTRIEYTNGTAIVLDANDKPTYMRTADGSVFTDFYDDGRPRSGTGPSGEHISFTYDDVNQTSTATIGDTTTVYDSAGNPIRMTTSDGHVYDNFQDGKPTHGYDPSTGRYFDISYGPNGEVTYQFGEHELTTFDADGNPVYAEYVDDNGNVVRVNYSVEIPLLLETANTTRNERNGISDLLGDLKTQLDLAETYWVSPAGTTFAAYRSVVQTAGDNLLGVLDEAITKLETTHRNYVGAETENANNLTPR
jgi:YD repeat-containing protein